MNEDFLKSFLEEKDNLSKLISKIKEFPKKEFLPIEIQQQILKDHYTFNQILNHNFKILTQINLDIPENFISKKDLLIYKTANDLKSYKKLEEPFKYEFSFISKIYNLNTNIIKHIPTKILNNETFILKCLETEQLDIFTYLFSKNKCDNLTIMETVLPLNPSCIKYTTEEIQDNTSLFLNSLKFYNNNIYRKSFNKNIYIFSNEYIVSLYSNRLQNIFFKVNCPIDDHNFEIEFLKIEQIEKNFNHINDKLNNINLTTTSVKPKKI